MNWQHQSEDMSFAEDGAAVMKGDGGWEAYPFGVAAGASGCHASRAEAMAAVEMVVFSTYCCAGKSSDDDS